MSFVVSVRHGPGGRARIHRAGCIHARRGGLITVNSLRPMRCTRWHPLAGGVYPSSAEAYVAAVGTAQPYGPYDCRRCEPEWFGRR